MTPTFAPVAFTATSTVVSAAPPSLPVYQDCTYPQDYWVEHAELWPQQMIIGNTTYAIDDIDQLLADQTGSIRNRLVVQLYFAYLNGIYNANSAAVDGTITEANRWLSEHSSFEQLAEVDRDAANELILALSNFNIGLTGPGPCPPYNAYTLTPSGTQSASDLLTTPVTLPTLTPTRYLVTLRPTATATKPDRPDPPTQVVEPPTNTPVPPQPSATSKPTAQPTKEPTSAPPEDTPVPTQPPEPTDPPQPSTPTPAG